MLAQAGSAPRRTAARRREAGPDQPWPRVALAAAAIPAARHGHARLRPRAGEGAARGPAALREARQGRGRRRGPAWEGATAPSRAESRGEEERAVPRGWKEGRRRSGAVRVGGRKEEALASHLRPASRSPAREQGRRGEGGRRGREEAEGREEQHRLLPCRRAGECGPPPSPLGELHAAARAGELWAGSARPSSLPAERAPLPPRAAPPLLVLLPRRGGPRRRRAPPSSLSLRAPRHGRRSARRRSSMAATSPAAGGGLMRSESRRRARAGAAVGVHERRVEGGPRACAAEGGGRSASRRGGMAAG